MNDEQRYEKWMARQMLRYKGYTTPHDFNIDKDVADSYDMDEVLTVDFNDKHIVSLGQIIGTDSVSGECGDSNV